MSVLIINFFAFGFISVSVVFAAENVTISEIQGDWWYSPYEWDYVRTSGIVTADFQNENKNGFFIQDPSGDNDPYTSDGVFVYRYASGNFVDVNVGDEVIVEGQVREYYGLTEIYRPYITIVSNDNPLPEPIELKPPFDDYYSDVYYEKIEGMLVSIPDLRTVAGTNVYGEVAGVRMNLGIRRVFRDDPRGTGELIFVDDEGGFLLNVRSGSIIKGLSGPLDYTYDEYKVLPARDAEPKIIHNGYQSEFNRIPSRFRELSIATYNLYNLFDEINEPEKDDPIYTAEEVELRLTKHARAIHDYLKEPDLIAVQEVENLEILERLANTDPIKSDYNVILIDGPDARGIDVGLLYRTDRVSIVSYEARQHYSYLNDSYGPGEDPNFPCPPGANPLFSRPPLVIHLEIQKNFKCGCTSDFWLIVNHFKSKSTYAPDYAPTEPRRTEQSIFVSSLVDEIQTADPNAKIVVLGDLNDFEGSAPLEPLTANGDLLDLIYTVRKRNRYTYIYRGVSQVLDHIMVTPSLKKRLIRSMVVHFNTDFPAPLYGDDPSIGLCSSDHDVILTRFFI